MNARGVTRSGGEFFLLFPASEARPGVRLLAVALSEPACWRDEKIFNVSLTLATL